MYGVTKYGATQFAENPIDEDKLGKIAPNLMRYLPDYCQKSKLIIEVEKSYSYELSLLIFLLETIEQQLMIDTATFALDIEERDLGIPTDLSKPYIFRREIIKARLRGQGKITKQMIKQVAETFSGAEVVVIEHTEISAFTIKFIGIKGIPPNMAGLIDAIEEIKPAHLVYDFAYTYTWWDMLKSANLTWNGANQKTWQELKTY